MGGKKLRVGVLVEDVEKDKPSWTNTDWSCWWDSNNRCSIACSIFDAYRRGVVVVRVFVEFTKRSSTDCRLPELVRASVRVLVNQSPWNEASATSVLHDKNTVFDSETIWSGSMSWSENVMTSRDTVFIFSDPEPNLFSTNIEENAKSSMELKLGPSRS